MTHSAEKLAEIFADIINEGFAIRGLGRTMLDTLDVYKNHQEHLTSKRGKGYVRWLNRGSLRMKSNRPYVMTLNQSPSVKEIYKIAKGENLSKDINLICEHVIPCSVILSYLNDIKKQNKKVTSQDILETQQKFYRRCIITDKENEKIKNKGYNSRMPDGWSFDMDIYARYKAVGFNWVKDLD